MVNLPLDSLPLPSAAGFRAGICIALLSLSILALAMTAHVSITDQPCPPVPDCPSQAKIDLVFILDKSGSIQALGKTGDVQLEGLIRALENPTIIPCDGSVAVAVITFAGSPEVVVPLTEIRSAADAKAVTDAIKLRKSPTESICVDRGDFEDTNYDAAIFAANRELAQSSRGAARRIMLMSSDGEPDKLNEGLDESIKSRDSAAAAGIPLELDTILVGIKTSSSEFVMKRSKLDAISFRVPESAGNPVKITIDANECNEQCASFDADCSRQADEFAESIRTILLSDIPTANLVVNTSDDAASTVTAGDAVSLRQAIEQANSNGGKTIITFAESVRGKKISPRTPLPALNAPDITIDGTSNSVTIDGSLISGGQGDGILIRSNHAVVRSLRIENFKRAGVTVAPNSPCDKVGCNRIEQNTLVNNTEAGVLILDPASSCATCLSHNVGNIISRNAISGSATPIDLGGDGITENDVGDADDGPNTLLNFPSNIKAEKTGSGVTLTGRAASNQVIEIFEVTGVRTESSKPVIDAVEFIGETTADMNGSFSFAVPTAGFYTATATDPLVSEFSCRNTSELTPIDDSCTAPAIAKITLEKNATTLVFKKATALAEPNLEKARVKSFTIENTGCGTLELSLKSIQRVGSDVGRVIDDDEREDSSFFSVRIVNDDGRTTADFANGQTIRIPQGDARKFEVLFHPVIPPLAGRTTDLSAREVLPDTFQSMLTFDLINGQGDHTVNLRVKVRTSAQLINSNVDRPRKPPLVELMRDGDILTVRFFIYDSDLSENTVDYEFLDGAGKPVALSQPDRTLRPTGLTRGQSYEVVEDFSNAKQHPEVAKVRVTLFDNGNRDSAVSGTIVQTNSLKALSSMKARSTVLILPMTDLPAVRKRK